MRASILALALAFLATPPGILGAEEKTGQNGVGTAASQEVAEENLPSAENTYAGPPATVRQIRSLFGAQDAAANGHLSAIELQKSMISQIERDLIEDDIPEEALHLAPSVAGYVLSGGNPAIAERLSMLEQLGKGDRHLLKGAAFYMQGRGDEAIAELQFVKVEALPPHIGGRVALARAMLAAGDEAAKQDFLQMAIALMPGSLVEESALRRSALSYAEAGDQQRFWSRANRYARRFARSLYAHEFMLAIVRQVVTLEQAGRKTDLDKLDLLLNRRDLASRRKLYAELARVAAAANMTELARFGAQRLRRLAAEGSVEAQIAELYDFIFEVASEDSDVAAYRLTNIRSDRLTGSERSLLEAALSVADQIRAPAQIRKPHAWEEAGFERTDIERRALSALEKAEALLVETAQ